MEKERKNLQLIGVNGFLKLVVELNKKNKFIPKGIYKFKSYENDEWVMKILNDR